MRNTSGIASNGFSLTWRRARRALGTGPHWPSPSWLVIGAVVIAAILLLTQFHLDSVATLDPRALPSWIGRWIGSFSAFGKSGWVLWPAAILLVAAMAAVNLARRMDRQIFASIGARLLFLICAVALPGLAVSIVKPLIGRVRPFVNGSVDPFLFHPFAYFRELFGSMPFPEYFYGSMPSGHTANAFAAAIAFGALMPRLRPLLLAFALTMAVSRLIIGVHHVTDVMAGALIGTCGALAIRNLFATHRLVFAVGSDGHVYAMPGPSLRRLGLALLRLLRGKGRTPVRIHGLAPEAER